MLAKDAPVLASTNQVLTGSTINGIYFNYQVACKTAVTAAIPQVYLQVVKNPGGNITIPTATAVGASDDKRYTIHQEMIQVENASGGNAKAIFNGVIVIPKGYKRFGPNDELIVQIFAPNIDITYCLQCHYKEFR